MSDMFPKSALLRPGYRPEQVDRYFETAHEIYDAGELDEMDSEGVRTVAFDVVLRGYQPQAVDAALDRLEGVLHHQRYTEARMHVRVDTPFYTGRRVSPQEWAQRQPWA